MVENIEDLTILKTGERELVHTGGRKNNKHFRPADGKFANG